MISVGELWRDAAGRDYAIHDITCETCRRVGECRVIIETTDATVPIPVEAVATFRCAYCSGVCAVRVRQLTPAESKRSAVAKELEPVRHPVSDAPRDELRPGDPLPPPHYCGGDHCSGLWNLRCDDPRHPTTGLRPPTNPEGP